MTTPPDLPVLGDVEQRVLGSLMEKQVTVPASYPLSFSALRTACNQASSRDPVLDLDETTVESTARALRERGLVRIVWSDTGRRTRRCHQTLDEVVPLDDAERALVTVLLLRGAQAPGELRARTERLHHFADRSEVEAVLQSLATRTPPLVEQLERRPGQQDHRWIHLLGPVADAAAPTGAAPPPEVDREIPIADGEQVRDERVRTSYATVATAYADAVADELAALPFDRWLLRRTVEAAAGRPMMDAGCGTGHVTAHLAAAGAEAQGLDLTPAMVDQARRRYPATRFDVGDLRHLMRPERAPGWGAVVCRYALDHLAASELPGAVAALSRPLAEGGMLALALHAGQEAFRLTTWLDHDVELDVVLHEPPFIIEAVTAAGLVDVEWYLRGRLACLDETSDRLYVLARRPG